MLRNKVFKFRYSVKPRYVPPVLRSCNKCSFRTYCKIASWIKTLTCSFHGPTAKEMKNPIVVHYSNLRNHLSAIMATDCDNYIRFDRKRTEDKKGLKSRIAASMQLPQSITELKQGLGVGHTRSGKDTK